MFNSVLDHQRAYGTDIRDFVMLSVTFLVML
jgi:hypothetical protein